MKTTALLAALWASCISYAEADPVAPLPRISSPMEAIAKDCTHLGSYSGTDYDDAAIDKWVRDKGGNSVYTFDFNGHIAAAKCNRVADSSPPQLPANNWVPVFRVTHEGREHYELVDSNSIVREGHIITYWSMNKGGIHDDLANSTLTNGKKLGYLQVQKRLDCVGMWEMETLQRKRVDLVTGTLIHEWQMPSEHLEKSKKYYLPGTEGFSKAKAICALDVPKPPPAPPKREPPGLKV